MKSSISYLLGKYIQNINIFKLKRKAINNKIYTFINIRLILTFKAMPQMNFAEEKKVKMSMRLQTNLKMNISPIFKINIEKLYKKCIKIIVEIKY